MAFFQIFPDVGIETTLVAFKQFPGQSRFCPLFSSQRVRVLRVLVLVFEQIFEMTAAAVANGLLHKQKRSRHVILIQRIHPEIEACMLVTLV